MKEPAITIEELEARGFDLTRQNTQFIEYARKFHFSQEQVRILWFRSTDRYVIIRDIGLDPIKLFEGNLYMDTDLKYIFSLLDLDVNFVESPWRV